MKDRVLLVDLENVQKVDLAKILGGASRGLARGREPGAGQSVH